MTVSTKIEIVHVGEGLDVSRSARNVIHGLAQTLATISVTTAATLGGSRPVVPASDRRIYARITPIDGNVIVAWGADPTASDTSGIIVTAGTTELIHVRPGELLSLIEAP